MLSAGGMPSLVAGAVLMAESAPPRISVVHGCDHHPLAAKRARAAQQLATWLDAAFVQLPIARLETAASLSPASLSPGSPRRRMVDQPTPQRTLSRSRLLLTAIAQATALDADRVVWPAQVDAEFDAIAAATEQALAAEQFARLECPEAPPIDTPLLELTDRQLVELGGHLDVEWELAWSCEVSDESPCRACPGCRRRHDAFDAAKVLDPLEQLAAAM